MEEDASEEAGRLRKQRASLHGGLILEFRLPVLIEREHNPRRPRERHSVMTYVQRKLSPADLDVASPCLSWLTDYLEETDRQNSTS